MHRVEYLESTRVPGEEIAGFQRRLRLGSRRLAWRVVPAGSKKLDENRTARRPQRCGYDQRYCQTLAPRSEREGAGPLCLGTKRHFSGAQHRFSMGAGLTSHPRTNSSLSPDPRPRHLPDGNSW